MKKKVLVGPDSSRLFTGISAVLRVETKRAPKVAPML